MIRRAVVADAGMIAEVLVDAWQTAYAGIIPTDYPESLSIEKYALVFRGLLEENTDSVFVYETDGNVAGFASGKIHYDHYDSEVVGLYVAPGYQGRGIGRMLLERMMTHFRSCGCRDTKIWTLKGAKNNSFYMNNGGVSSESKIMKIGGQEYPGIGFVFDLKSLLVSNLHGGNNGKKT